MIQLAKGQDVSVKSTSTKKQTNKQTNKKHFCFLYFHISHKAFCVCESIMIKAGATSGTGTAYPSGALEFTPGF